jgi:hypothetical protein
MVTFVKETAPPCPLVIAAVFLSQDSRCTIGIVMKTCYTDGTTTAAQKQKTKRMEAGFESW